MALLRTPLRPVLRAVFRPLGRMALTNYLSATVIVLVVGRLAGGVGDWGQGTVALVAGAVLAVQCAWSAMSLRRYRQGPLECLWRLATWARRPTLSARPRRPSPAAPS